MESSATLTVLDPNDRLRAMTRQLDEMMAVLPATKDEAASLDTPTLLALLGTAPLAITQLLTAFANIWLVLEDRNEDLSAFKNDHNDIYKWIRRIADGSVSASAISTFGHKSRVISKVSKLPIKVQEKLAADPRVPYLDPKTPDDLGNHVLKRVTDMEKWELEQVFDQGEKELRTLEQQAKYVRQMNAPIPVAKRRGEIVRGRLALNQDTKRVRTIGPDADLEHAVAVLKAVGYTVTPPGESE